MARDVSLSAESEISCVMKSILDRLQQEISTRFTRLSDLNFKFGFLLDVENLLNKDNAHNDLEKNCKIWGNFTIQILMEQNSMSKYVTARCYSTVERKLNLKLH